MNKFIATLPLLGILIGMISLLWLLVALTINDSKVQYEKELKGRARVNSRIMGYACLREIIMNRDNDRIQGYWNKLSSITDRDEFDAAVAEIVEIINGDSNDP